MKANRKFLRGDEEAVSPVIAVILMVAITVVLAATVYVWVSGFGSQSNQPAKTMSMTSAAAIASSGSSDYWKNYTVASATPGMKYGDVKFTLDGADMTFDDDAACNDLGGTASTWESCANSAGRRATDVIAAGDIVSLHAASSLSGKTLRVLDSQANSVILTLVVG